MKKLLLIIVIVFCISKVYNISNRYTTPFTHDLISVINPAISIDYGYLSNVNSLNNTVLQLNSFLISNNMMKCSKKSCIFSTDPSKKSINIIIESDGGYTHIALGIYKILKSLREQGVIINCYVSKAKSSAFFLLITSCDKRIGIGDVSLMQHKSFYFLDYKLFTSSTLKNDVMLSKLESDVLGIDAKVWLNLTRGPKDHLFEKKEVEKYKLIDEYLELTL